jgi:hypothetical protein
MAGVRKYFGCIMSLVDASMLRNTHNHEKMIGIKMLQPLSKFMQKAQ